ncbi:MAG: hypothetical protein RL885_24455 [Planctomycetota bacterium]
MPAIFLIIAGALMLLIASANLFAFSKFRYLENMRKVSTPVRQVFLVQNGYLMFVQLGMAGLCFFFPEELASGESLGRAICGYLALFWGFRVGLQLFFYDKALRRENRPFDIGFILADSYLAIVFGAAALV